MISLAHIVNPVVVPKSSDLFAAQPITFESMRRAQARAHDDTAVRVSLFSAQYPEDHPIVPDYLVRSRDLNRSVLDIHPNAGDRKLPLAEDILQRLYESSTADYLIYTNVDIGLAENFYIRVGEIIQQGYDAFSITRRTIPDHFSSVDELPLIYQEEGLPHPGWDCFVFRREAFPAFRLDDVCLGVPPVGRIMLCNCLRFSEKFTLITDERLSFHIGNEGTWKGKRSQMQILNTRKCLELVRALRDSATAPDVRNQLETHVDKLAENLHRISTAEDR